MIPNLFYKLNIPSGLPFEFENLIREYSTDSSQEEFVRLIFEYGNFGSGFDSCRISPIRGFSKK